MLPTRKSHSSPRLSKYLWNGFRKPKPPNSPRRGTSTKSSWSSSRRVWSTGRIGSSSASSFRRLSCGMIWRWRGGFVRGLRGRCQMDGNTAARWVRVSFRFHSSGCDCVTLGSKLMRGIAICRLCRHSRRSPPPSWECTPSRNSSRPSRVKQAQRPRQGSPSAVTAPPGVVPGQAGCAANRSVVGYALGVA